MERRVYRPELREALGCGKTWFRKLQQSGKIPRGRVDPGGRREWWLESEARAIFDRLAAEAASCEGIKGPRASEGERSSP